MRTTTYSAGCSFLGCEHCMRALALALVLFVLAYCIPIVAAEDYSWGITNPNTCPEFIDYTQTQTYVCVVEWYAQLPMNAKVVVSLIDTEHGILLDSEEYDISANVRVEETTTLHASVPAIHTFMQLTVELKVFDHMIFGPQSYDLTVQVVPELPAVAPMLLVSLIPVMTATTRKRARRRSPL